jgi:hypothetical protein
MKGTQEIKNITTTDKGEVEIQLMHAYDIILLPEEVRKLMNQLGEALDKLDKQ